MFNPFNLASDFMEPFRPLVDEMVANMQPEKFDKEEKHRLLTVLNKEVEIAGKKEVLGNAIKIYCKSIFDALNDKDISLIRFYFNEL